ncbi:unnamed protein product [Rhodiola kirilowii]
MKPLWELMKLEKEFAFSSVAADDESSVATVGDYNNPPSGGKKKGKSIWSCRFLWKGSSLRARMGSRLQLQMLLGYEGVEVINPEADGSRRFLCLVEEDANWSSFVKNLTMNKFL